MLKRTVAVALALVLGACSKDDPAMLPTVDGHWSVQGADVICDGATVETQPAAAPFTEITCTWHDVSYQGVNHCTVMVTYSRADANSAWGDPYVFLSTADCSVR